jgi:hypothetical protein
MLQRVRVGIKIKKHKCTEKNMIPTKLAKMYFHIRCRHFARVQNQRTKNTKSASRQVLNKTILFTGQ